MPARRKSEEQVAREQERLNRVDESLQLERIQQQQEYEQRVHDELDKEDRKRLQLKWGGRYTDAEWVQMENMYQEYANEYEMSVDREQVLKNICKTALKMDQALDDGDIKAYKDLSSVYDQLRKGGRFTDSQKREQKERDIDSIGQLVQFVEDEGGIIPEAPNPMDEPQDKIDFMIADMKHYVDNLVKNELGLGNLIESYIKKTEDNKPQTVDDVMSRGFTQEEATQQDAMDFANFLASQMDADAMYANAMRVAQDPPDTSVVQEATPPPEIPGMVVEGGDGR